MPPSTGLAAYLSHQQAVGGLTLPPAAVATRGSSKRNSLESSAGSIRGPFMVHPQQMLAQGMMHAHPQQMASLAATMGYPATVASAPSPQRVDGGDLMAGNLGAFKDNLFVAQRWSLTLSRPVSRQESELELHLLVNGNGLRSGGPTSPVLRPVPAPQGTAEVAVQSERPEGAGPGVEAAAAEEASDGLAPWSPTGMLDLSLSAGPVPPGEHPTKPHQGKGPRSNGAGLGSSQQRQGRVDRSFLSAPNSPVRLPSSQQGDRYACSREAHGP